MNKAPIVVTGASSGIGAKTAETLLSNGYPIVAIARREDILQKLFGDNAMAKIFPCDLADTENIPTLPEKIAGEVGAIGGLVCSAGKEYALPLHMTKAEKIEDIFKLNTFAPILLASAFAAKGRAIEGASFVLVSSLSAHEGVAGRSLYAASKAALEGFTIASAPEFSEKNIRINCIAPGIVETSMTEAFFARLSDEQKKAFRREYPLGLGTPEDIAAFIVYLLSDEARWLTGQTYILDGGHLARK